jgi:hypothetical protein
MNKRNGRFMDDVYLSADKYIEYTSEQADNIMQMKLGKDYDNYIVYDDKGKETSYTEEGQNIFIMVLDAVELCLSDVGIYNEENKVLHYKKEINSKDRDSAEDRGRTYEADNNPERLFTHNGEEFYITSIEESEDE